MKSCGLFSKIDRFDSLMHFLLNFIVFMRIGTIPLFDKLGNGFKTPSRERTIGHYGQRQAQIEVAIGI
jgi:hypothetical protein